MSSNDERLSRIAAMARSMRRNLIDTSLAAGAASSHFGGALSLIEILATLYGSVMRYDAKSPGWPERDRFILSKGHGCLAYYMALVETGLIPREDLAQFEKSDSYLIGHPVMNRARGIEFSNGSLGMGLSLGIGVALAVKRKKLGCRVFVVMGDGECNEGSVWEAAQAAAHFKLENVTAIIDRNGFQQTGANDQIMSIGDAAAKWASFGWQAETADGHDIAALDKALSRRPEGGPNVIVAKTTKGKGFSFAENNNDWHHKILTQAQHAIAVAELEAAERAR